MNTSLTNISDIREQSSLNRNMKSLNFLQCQYCPILTSIPQKKYEILRRFGSRWIYDKDSVPYKNNLQKLVELQKWFRKRLLYNKFMRLIPIITEIFYSPGCRGKRIAEKEFQSITNINF